MQIRRDQSAEELQFHVSIAKDIWPERTNRHVQIAALIGALTDACAFNDPDDEPAVAQEIRADSKGPEFQHGMTLMDMTRPCGNSH